MRAKILRIFVVLKRTLFNAHARLVSQWRILWNSQSRIVFCARCFQDQFPALRSSVAILLNTAPLTVRYATTKKAISPSSNCQICLSGAEQSTEIQDVSSDYSCDESEPELYINDEIDENECVHKDWSSLLKWVQGSKPRGRSAYTGMSRATEFRKKAALNSLKNSAQGTRSITSYFGPQHSESAELPS